MKIEYGIDLDFKDRITIFEMNEFNNII
jgi:hypothetical protein